MIDPQKLLEARIDVLQNEIKQALAIVHSDFHKVLGSFTQALASIDYRLTQVEEDLEIAGLRGGLPVPLKPEQNNDDKNYGQEEQPAGGKEL